MRRRATRPDSRLQGPIAEPTEICTKLCSSLSTSDPITAVHTSDSCVEGVRWKRFVWYGLKEVVSPQRGSRGSKRSGSRRSHICSHVVHKSVGVQRGSVKRVPISERAGTPGQNRDGRDSTTRESLAPVDRTRHIQALGTLAMVYLCCSSSGKAHNLCASSGAHLRKSWQRKQRKCRRDRLVGGRREVRKHRDGEVSSYIVRDQQHEALATESIWRGAKAPCSPEQSKLWEAGWGARRVDSCERALSTSVNEPTLNSERMG